MAIDVHWTELSRSQRDIERRFADVPERNPPVFTLEGMAGEVEDVWRRHGDLSLLTWTTRRWLAHVLFHPLSEPHRWPAQDRKLVHVALSEIARRPRWTRSLVKRVLSLWPADLDAADDLRSGLTLILREYEGLGLRAWQQRVLEYHLLSADGPARLANRLAQRPEDAAALLTDAGLTGELATSGFVAAMERSLCQEIETALGRGSYDQAVGLLPTLAPDGRLRFQQHGPHVAEALLKPFVGRADPPESVQDSIGSFLLQHLKDPRRERTSWIRVAPTALDVLHRWLVRSSLDDFFRLIARTAQDDHWRYRRAFWSAYFAAGHLSHAWVVLGESARTEALRQWRTAAPAYGKLTGGGDPNHCVLVLRIGELVIAEWSHNGACRVWNANREAAPKLYQEDYPRSDLRQEADHQQVHYGNLHYTWQRELADVIRRQTGIGMRQIDYRVR